MLFQFFLLFTFCLDNYNTFKIVSQKNKEITQKQRAFILSLKSSILLFIFSLFFNYKLCNSNYDSESYMQNISNEDQIFSNIVIAFFTSYLISDITIGYFNYHKFMLPISGYIHHFSYLVLNIISCYINVFPIYILFLFEELPTILLSFGSYDENYRNDMTFGVVFFLTRILYHIFLLYVFRNNFIVLFFGLLVLPLHLWWFKGWINKYLKPLVSVKKTL